MHHRQWPWLLVSAALFALGARGGSNPKSHYLEVPENAFVTTFDLRTVKLIQPGRFMIDQNLLDNPEVIRLKLALLDQMPRFCRVADGVYPPPGSLLTLGKPDLPIQNIKVKFRIVSWPFPYSYAGFGRDGEREDIWVFPCGRNDSDTADRILNLRLEVTNGSHSTYIYDCTHGLWGQPVLSGDDQSQATMTPVLDGTIAFDDYIEVCRAVLNEMPYLPK